MIGINGFSGETFTDIVRGNTYPFTFTFADENSDPVDITDWAVYIAIKYSLDSTTSDLEVSIPVTDAISGIATGFIEDDETLALTAGPAYISSYYIKDDGKTYIIDMARIRIKENTTNRVDQA